MRLATISGHIRPALGFKRLCRAFALLALTAAVLGSAGNAPAQVCGTPPCGGGQPVTITWAQDLEFGTLAGDGTSAGTATINPVSGAKTVAGGVYDFGGISNAAVFDIRGTRNTAFTITLPPSITLTSGGNSMTLNGFTSSPSLVGVLDNSGKATVNVGATLQVGVNQAAGAYSGVFTVTVDYQ
jgi:hypothetical protein